MSKTTDEIIKMLGVDEPDYALISKELSEKDYLVLNKLVKDNKEVALVAICILGRLNSKRSLNTIIWASENSDPDFREAAATALKHRRSSPKVINLLKKLADDNDIGVRKATLETIAYAGITDLKESVQKLSQKETNPMMAKLVQQVILKIDKPVTQ